MCILRASCFYWSAQYHQMMNCAQLAANHSSIGCELEYALLLYSEPPGEIHRRLSRDYRISTDEDTEARVRYNVVTFSMAFRIRYLRPVTRLPRRKLGERVRFGDVFDRTLQARNMPAHRITPQRRALFEARRAQCLAALQAMAANSE